jgi:3-dehydroquinate synthase
MDYPIILGNISQTFPEWLKQQSYQQILTISDENTLRHCWPTFSSDLGDVGLLPPVTIPAGELYKNLRTCEQLWQSMLDARLDRKALIINLGGGVIGDMGGFCAATWKRGVDFVQIPTTLLSMTDAAIGGKLGIDFQYVKNTIGVFKNPAAVFVDPAFLKTLPSRELLSGFAEVLKHALIGAPDLWKTIVQTPVEGPLQYHSFDWTALLEASIAVKVRVVEADPFEKGLRMVLNYGHTLGHAVESHLLETSDPMTHGEAVAWGMIMESRLVYGEVERLEMLEKTIRRFFPERLIPKSAVDDLWNWMLQDKKNSGGKVRMVVPGDTPFSMEVRAVEKTEISEIC